MRVSQDAFVSSVRRELHVADRLKTSVSERETRMVRKSSVGNVLKLCQRGKGESSKSRAVSNVCNPGGGLGQLFQTIRS